MKFRLIKRAAIPQFALEVHQGIFGNWVDAATVAPDFMYYEKRFNFYTEEQAEVYAAKLVLYEESVGREFEICSSE